MKIGILSGKGGTGKTTLATNLAFVLQPPILIDSDVEEPNAALFFKGTEKQRSPVKKTYPVVDGETCQSCGMCGDFCRFNALLPAKKGVIVYREMCHGCGGCALVCPTNSISYEERVVGEIVEMMISEKTRLYSGIMNVGELSGVELIKSLNEIQSDEIILVDSPPGTSCTTSESIQSIDYAILVTEATAFGMSDLLMVIELLDKRKIPYGVVINKAGVGDDALSLYLNINKIQLLGEIPFEKKYALSYSKGELLSEKHPDYEALIQNIINHLPFELTALKKGGSNE